MSWFSDTFASIGDFFTNLWNNHLKPDVQSVEEVAEAFFSAAIKDTATQLGVVGMKIVTDAVTAAENAGGNGSAKLAAAVAAATADLSAAALSVPAHVLNAAIEAAVAQMNAAKAAVAPDAPVPEVPPAGEPVDPVPAP